VLGKVGIFKIQECGINKDLRGTPEGPLSVEEPRMSLELIFPGGTL
jgi:hypothetical protein